MLNYFAFVMQEGIVGRLGRSCLLMIMIDHIKSYIDAKVKPQYLNNHI